MADGFGLEEEPVEGVDLEEPPSDFPEEEDDDELPELEEPEEEDEEDEEVEEPPASFLAAAL